MKVHPAAEQQLRELEPDDDDIALLEHVFGDDAVRPQGLHQGGWKQTDEEQDWADEYRYGDGLDALLEDGW